MSFGLTRRQFGSCGEERLAQTVPSERPRRAENVSSIGDSERRLPFLYDVCYIGYGKNHA